MAPIGRTSVVVPVRRELRLGPQGSARVSSARRFTHRPIMPPPSPGRLGFGRSADWESTVRRLGVFNSPPGPLLSRSRLGSQRTQTLVTPCSASGDYREQRRPRYAEGLSLPAIRSRASSSGSAAPGSSCREASWRQSSCSGSSPAHAGWRCGRYLPGDRPARHRRVDPPCPEPCSSPARPAQARRGSPAHSRSRPAAKGTRYATSGCRASSRNCASRTVTATTSSF